MTKSELPVATCDNSRQLKYYWIYANYQSGAPSLELVNGYLLRGKKLIFCRDKHNPGFRHLLDVPRFHFIEGHGRMPRDLDDYAGWWIISQKMKTVLETIDPEACEFVRCDFQLSDGSDGPELWLCDIVRTINPIDERNSAIHVRKNHDGTLSQTLDIFGPTVIFQGRTEGAHLFRTPYGGEFCDEILKDACKHAGLRNVDFNLCRKKPKYG